MEKQVHYVTCKKPRRKYLADLLHSPNWLKGHGIKNLFLYKDGEECHASYISLRAKSQNYRHTVRERPPPKERKKMESRVGAFLFVALIFPALVGAVVRHYKFSVSTSLRLLFFSIFSCSCV